MNNEEAKRILSLYRPGTPDKTDLAFTEALEQAKGHASAVRWQDRPDPELGRWLQDHCSSYLSIRSKFQVIPAPVALRNRILAEYKPASDRIIPLRPIWHLYAAAVLALCLSLAAFFWHSHGRTEDFNTYRTRMVLTALRPYSMNLESHDWQAVTSFLLQQKAPADYVLPNGLAGAELVGCAVLRWQGEPVSMLCFQSGQPLPSGQKTDLWLFVVNQSSVTGGPGTGPPAMTPVKSLKTLAWARDGKTYILATAGDEALLRKYF